MSSRFAKSLMLSAALAAGAAQAAPEKTSQGASQTAKVLKTPAKAAAALGPKPRPAA